MKRFFVTATLFVVLLMTGCSDPTELGDRAIIQAAAVDFDGAYRVTALLFGSSGSGGDTIDASQENVIRVTGVGNTLAAAVDNISLIDGKRIYMSETKLLILGGGFEDANALDALKTLYYDMRCSLNMPVCCVESGERAEDIAALRFTEGMTAADKPLSLIENAYAMGVSPKTTLLDLLADSAGEKASLLPVLAVAENGGGMTDSGIGENKTAVLRGSRYFVNGLLGDSFDEDKTAALMLTTRRSSKTTLNYRFGGSEATCEAYGIKVDDRSTRERSVLKVTAKFRTRNGGRLSEEERKAALAELVRVIESSFD